METNWLTIEFVKRKMRSTGFPGGLLNNVISNDAVLISIVTGMNRLSFDYFSVSPKFKTVIDQLPETDIASG